MSVTYATFDHIATTIKRMPIRALRFEITSMYGITGDDRILDFFTIESESSYTLDPITKPTSSGGIVTIAYRINAKIYIPHNRYDQNLIMAYFNAMQTYGNYYVRLYLGNETIGGVTAPDVINADAGMTLQLQSSSFSYQIESVEYRPRLIITLSSVEKNISGIFQ